MRAYWRRGAVVLAILAAAAGLVFWNAFWQASRSLRKAATDLAAQQEIRFTIIPLVRAAPPGLEAFSAPMSFRDAAWFQGRLYLAGDGGLLSYDHQGKLETRYRVGLELPPSRVVGIAA